MAEETANGVVFFTSTVYARGHICHHQGQQSIPSCLVEPAHDFDHKKPFLHSSVHPPHSITVDGDVVDD